MITHISNTETFPNLWKLEMFPPLTPVPSDIEVMPCWKAGKYYVDCGNINEDGLYHNINLEEIIRLDFKVPPGIAPKGKNNSQGDKLQKLADKDFDLLLIELDKFMKRGIIKILHIDFLIDNERELVLMENVMKYSTRTSHLEIQYPTVDTKSKLEYKDLDNSWSSITIKHGHKQVLQTEDDFYK